MGTPRSHALSIANQAFALRACFPKAKIRVKPTELVWEATLRPTPLSRDYRVRMTYCRGMYPRVVVLDPALKPRPDQKLPHFYFDDGCLCLHEDDQWNSKMLIVDTIIPWASEWLAHYELWLPFGKWYGNAVNKDQSLSTTTP